MFCSVPVPLIPAFTSCTLYYGYCLALHSLPRPRQEDCFPASLTGSWGCRWHYSSWPKTLHFKHTYCTVCFPADYPTISNCGALIFLFTRPLHSLFLLTTASSDMQCVSHVCYISQLELILMQVVIIFQSHGCEVMEVSLRRTTCILTHAGRTHWTPHLSPMHLWVFKCIDSPFSAAKTQNMLTPTSLGHS